ncbi:peptidoglycan-binding domain-containing protein [Aliirhizobium smilacinae]|uniref:Peptidoglycan-binding protein n=1 Tax=Aliirhizobium smilacinae TaxID=1395944 RepID=A0A5C4XSP3_9HYPH|nr:peptidoglycan-binding domain-containing protein [Rhizobium smilacinae]TNM65704.1 peptidoglycan-binding protein [Rhizobium smilacinae]
MTTRKRKSPKGRRTAKEQSLPSRILAGTGSAVLYGATGSARGIGGAIARNPKATLYATTFIVAFSFVAANALWYQPAGHLSPFLATRDARDPNAIAGYRQTRQADPADVTTFRIERAPSGGQNSPAQSSSSQSAPRQPSSGQTVASPVAQPAIQAPAAVPVDDIRSIIAGQTQGGQSAPASSAGDPALVAGIQRELARRGIYQGTDDGLMGPRTETAILFFEEASGLPQRGVATPELLAVLQSPSRSQAQAAATPLPIPRQAPRADAQKAEVPKAEAQRSASRTAAQPYVQQVKAPARNEDPITAAIRSSERQPGMTPPAEIPGSRRVATSPAQTPKRPDPVPASQMVLQIQKGLSNIAYTDVEVDGVAGSQTKAAIRRFQKHYRLPETGEPDQIVLQKLKAIGAL